MFAVFKLLRKYIQMSKVWGIEIEETDSGLSVRYSIARKHKGKIEFIDKGLYETASSCFEIPNNEAVAISITGKTVLSKSVEKKECAHLSNEEIASKVLPGIRSSEFCLQFNESGSKIFVFAARKENVNKILKQIKAKHIVRIQLGVFNITGTRNFANDPQTIGRHNLTWNTEGISSYIYNPATCSNSNDMLIAQSTAVGLLLEEAHFGILQDITAKAEEEFLYMKLIKPMSIIAATAIIVLISASLSFKKTFYNRNYDIAPIAHVYELAEIRYKTLFAETDAKKKFLNQLNWLRKTNVCYISDIIATSASGNIYFTSLLINPIDHKQSIKEKRLIFENNSASIKGTCKNASELSTWLENLQEIHWIHKVDILDFSLNPQNGQGEFLIKIEGK